ncbi:hypothetical protein DL771_003122 [Monosporascus sp. 5C6A]|nr:hypothetical protein DL771_003122 [Monosporascus sp. 5C6A]
MPSAVDAGTSSRELPVRNNPDIESFDIVETYNRLLAEDPDLIKSLAAIEAMIEALRHVSSTTVHETMDLMKAQSAKLQSSVTNPIAVYHGTDLFQQYFLKQLKQPGPDRETTSSHRNFEVVREQLLRNGTAFVQKAKRARETIAWVGRRFIRDNYTILTHGGSRAVGTLLERATESHGGDPPRRFNVIYVIDETKPTESNRMVEALRAKGVKVATIPVSAVAYAMEKVDRVILGAEAVASNGGVISRMGTYQIALIAKAHNKELFVAAEQYKFGDTFPENQSRLGFPGFKQNIISFRSSRSQGQASEDTCQAPSDPVDYTPPEFITSFFTDQGDLTPQAVARNILDFIVDKPVDLPM